MKVLGILVDRRLRNLPELTPSSVTTRFGTVTVYRGTLDARPLVLVARHGAARARLSDRVNHRANLLAMKASGATDVISCSICTVLRGDLPIARPLVGRDIQFSGNCLPTGEACTCQSSNGMSGRDLQACDRLASETLSDAVAHAWESSGSAPLAGKCGTVPLRSDGPGNLLEPGLDFASETSGPEAVLANELGMDFALAGFGVAYGDGIVAGPTPRDAVDANTRAAAAAFRTLIAGLVAPRSCCATTGHNSD